MEETAKAVSIFTATVAAGLIIILILYTTGKPTNAQVFLLDCRENVRSLRVTVEGCRDIIVDETVKSCDEDFGTSPQNRSVSVNFFDGCAFSQIDYTVLSVLLIGIVMAAGLCAYMILLIYKTRRIEEQRIRNKLEDLHTETMDIESLDMDR